ncbi:Holliday junction branch migration protein RuvA [Tepidibacillus fermentans]|uniref:Holliday junction branch migration complex subunit RuvA n=1 Tax=Tepidibacillus fermentans TaxID=1281767 RepID=A0A4V2URT9_9BACI|nr:Holliday junction branch migration protein RuvA [Tepidibacillus fermentans]TCS78772.1 Holliday junction DNA helicase subunit RuvA [Tepidibacillus fermentans]
MIDFVQGTIVDLDEESVIVNVNGIGYQVFVPRPEEYQSMLNQFCMIYTHHHMREDWMGLYGFQDKEERYLFRLLLGVSGIGPKGALAIIGQGNPNQVIQAIASEDEKFLTQLPGVGKKTAQRIILDLKDKVKGLSSSGNLFDTMKREEIEVIPTEQGSDLKEALKSLGYHEQEIHQVLKSLQPLIEKGESLDRLIKLALQNLMRE